MKNLSIKLLCLPIIHLAFHTSFVNAQEAEALTSIKGQIVFPEVISEDINMEGLSLKGVEVILQGPSSIPRRPRSDNWKEMTREEKKVWNEAFDKSDAYDVYREQVKAARAGRFTKTTTLDEDGNFSFEGIKPSWYQMKMMIKPANAPEQYDDHDFSHARAYALKQFFVRDASKPVKLGTIRAKLKNVPMKGDMAAEINMLDYKGNSLKLSDFRGKYVLFDCWATWCGPCIAQMPYLEAVSEKYDGANFVTIGINIDEKIDNAKSYLKNKPSNYKQVYAGVPKLHKELSVAYGIESIPAIWLINPEGKIIARGLMGKNIAKEVEKALAVAKK